MGCAHDPFFLKFKKEALPFLKSAAPLYGKRLVLLPLLNYLFYIKLCLVDTLFIWPPFLKWGGQIKYKII
jgi:hypothetical protein